MVLGDQSPKSVSLDNTGLSIILTSIPLAPGVSISASRLYLNNYNGYQVLPTYVDYGQPTVNQYKVDIRAAVILCTKHPPCPPGAEPSFFVSSAPYTDKPTGNERKILRMRLFCLKTKSSKKIRSGKSAREDCTQHPYCYILIER